MAIFGDSYQQTFQPPGSYFDPGYNKYVAESPTSLGAHFTQYPNSYGRYFLHEPSFWQGFEFPQTPWTPGAKTIALCDFVSQYPKVTTTLFAQPDMDYGVCPNTVGLIVCAKDPDNYYYAAVQYFYGAGWPQQTRWPVQFIIGKRTGGSDTELYRSDSLNLGIGIADGNPDPLTFPGATGGLSALFTPGCLVFCIGGVPQWGWGPVFSPFTLGGKDALRTYYGPRLLPSGDPDPNGIGYFFEAQILDDDLKAPGQSGLFESIPENSVRPSGSDEFIHTSFIYNFGIQGTQWSPRRRSRPVFLTVDKNRSSRPAATNTFAASMPLTEDDNSIFQAKAGAKVTDLGDGVLLIGTAPWGDGSWGGFGWGDAINWSAA